MLLKIELHDQKDGGKSVYENTRVKFGLVKKVMKFMADDEKQRNRVQVLRSKLDDKVITRAEEKELDTLIDAQNMGAVTAMEELVVALIDNPKVTVDTLDNGLELDTGTDQLRKVLNDAMGGLKAEAEHPAKK
ncbi:hypothetical protein [Furfurilactobacillus entadae]|uniref:hypothetical protein n=1 Tax=Furfurilactobacillus entadae TaxID=2922307 RepID=UPI0035E813E5